jgi:hypothetical protein
MLDESLQETHELIAVAIDPIEQLPTPRVHLDLPRSMSSVAAAVMGLPQADRHRVCTTGRRSTACSLARYRRCWRTAQYLSFCQNRKQADCCRAGSALTGMGTPSHP